MITAAAIGLVLGLVVGFWLGLRVGARHGADVGYDIGRRDGADSLANEYLAAGARAGDPLDVWPVPAGRVRRPS